MNADEVDIVRTVGFVSAGSIFWLQYWDLKDRKRPEPRRNLVGAFGLGGAACVLAMALYWVATELGVPLQAMTGTSRVLFVCLAVIGPVEEVSKFVAARFVVFRWRAFDERVDGVVYAAAVSLGFAAAENILWLPGMDARGGLVRALCTPIVHTLFGVIWGYGTAIALLEARTRTARIAWQAGSLALAALAHGAYDATLALGAPPWVVAVVVLVLWMAVLGIARRAALRDDVVLGAAPRPD